MSYYGRPKRAGHYILQLWFLSSSFFVFLIYSVYHTSTHDLALVRIQNACLKSAARGWLTQNLRKKSPSAHHRTTLSGYIFTTEGVVPCKNKSILKNCRPEPPPSVDGPKIILFKQGTMSEMK